jgi:hypothetical protein
MKGNVIMHPGSLSGEKALAIAISDSLRVFKPSERTPKLASNVLGRHETLSKPAVDPVERLSRRPTPPEVARE